MAFCKPEQCRRVCFTRRRHWQTDPHSSWIWLYSVSSSLLRRQWGVTSPAKKKKNASKVSVLPSLFRSALFWFLSFSRFIVLCWLQLRPLLLGRRWGRFCGRRWRKTDWCWPVREAVGLRRRGTALPVLWSGEMRLFVEGEVVLCWEGRTTAFCWLGEGSLVRGWRPEVRWDEGGRSAVAGSLGARNGAAERGEGWRVWVW